MKMSVLITLTANKLITHSCGRSQTLELNSLLLKPDHRWGNEPFYNVTHNTIPSHPLKPFRGVTKGGDTLSSNLDAFYWFHICIYIQKTIDIPFHQNRRIFRFQLEIYIHHMTDCPFYQCLCICANLCFFANSSGNSSFTRTIYAVIYNSFRGCRCHRLVTWYQNIRHWCIS